MGVDAIPGTALPAKKTLVASQPVEVIAVPNPELLKPDQYEMIGEKVTPRLAQRPGSYVVFKYARP